MKSEGEINQGWKDGGGKEKGEKEGGDGSRKEGMDRGRKKEERRQVEGKEGREKIWTGGRGTREDRDSKLQCNAFYNLPVSFSRLITFVGFTNSPGHWGLSTLAR